MTDIRKPDTPDREHLRRSTVASNLSSIGVAAVLIVVLIMGTEDMPAITWWGFILGAGCFVVAGLLSLVHDR